MSNRKMSNRKVLTGVALAALTLMAGCAPGVEGVPGPPPAAMAPSAPPPPAPPPPPPPVAAPAPPAMVGEVAVTGSRIPGSAADLAPVPVSPDRPQTQSQAGILTAGDYDDLLNPQAYARYVGSKAQQFAALPYVDTRAAITVTITDADGRPRPFVPVRISRPQGGTLELETLANGSVVLFPALDGLGRTAEITVPGPRGQTTRRTLSVGSDRRLEIALPGAPAAVRAMDLMLVIDATGSMGDEIDYLKVELDSIVTALKDRHPGLDLRLGLIVYRDIGDEYVVRQYAFTGNTEAVQTLLSKQSAGGGGDYPEAVDQAMAAAVGASWRDNAAKALVLVADAPPHDQHIGATWATTLQAREKRIQIVPVAASGVAEKAEFVMRAMAAVTQSRYLFLTDDSGVGNPHAAPEVKCYVVTRLDALLRRVLDGIVSGRRIEPESNEIIRRVGDYDDGVCEPR